MKKIDHGNIVKVVESFENKSTIFIVMELFTGVEIFEYISKINLQYLEINNCMPLEKTKDSKFRKKNSQKVNEFNKL